MLNLLVTFLLAEVARGAPSCSGGACAHVEEPVHHSKHGALLQTLSNVTEPSLVELRDDNVVCSFYKKELGEQCSEDHVIQSMDECEDAVEYLGLCHVSAWQKAGGNANVPKGCSHRPTSCGDDELSDLHFNEHASGAARDDLTPICCEPTASNCKSWCASHEQPWSEKCTWSSNCAGCSDCETPAPTPVPQPPPTSANSVEVCIDEWIFITDQRKFQICYMSGFEGPKPAVLTFDWGTESLVGHSRFLDLGFIGIKVEVETWTSCNWKMRDAMTWLKDNGNDFLTQHGITQFSFANKNFIVGYSRAGICAARSSVPTPIGGFLGVIVLGAWRYTGTGDFSDETPEMLSFSCGEDSVQNKLDTLNIAMGSRFTDISWDDCTHTSYKKYKQEIWEAQESFFNRLIG